MPARYPRLAAPGAIGSMRVRNRLVLCPMGDGLGNPDGTVSDVQASYYEARARGGAGLVLVGSVAVAYPTGAYAARQLGISEDRHLAGLARLADGAHRHGAAVAAQLVHDGAAALHDIAEGRPLLVPSKPRRPAADPLAAMVTAAELDAMTAPFRGPRSALRYREATDDDLAGVVEAFAGAAERAAAAGFDGVELHAGHGYLLDAFLSPVSNHRHDAYGGDVVGRARLLCEVLAAVRARVGDGLAVWCRLNGEERHRPGGETVDDALAVARMAVDAGADALHVSAYADPGVAVGITDAHTPHAPGALVHLAAAVKRAVSVPVITFGRLSPDAAEAALVGGKADFVAMGRALLADPELPSKILGGDAAAVRPCIYQYRCIGNVFLGRPVRCAANPAMGDGDEAGVAATAAPRRYVVAGGGPAGMEAARLLAAAGHDVSLWEAGDRLGGRLALAARTDPPLADLLAWLVRGVTDAGVEVHLETAVSGATAAAAGADAVVVATGARWDAPGIRGMASPIVRTIDGLRAWLDGEDPHALGERVVVLGGGKIGLSVAAHARRLGHSVTVFEAGSVLAPELGLPGRFRLVHDLATMGVDLRPGTDVDEIGDATVMWHDGRGAGGQVGADAVIVAAGATPDARLADELRGAGVPATAIGDCADVAYVEGALAAARRVARGAGALESAATS